MAEPTSAGNGATPEAGTTPATGTSTTGGATPSGKQVSLSLEEALAKIEELQRHAQNKTEEAARHGKSLSAAEKELAAYKAAEEAAKAAQMSELEKAQKQAADSQEQLESLAAELYEARVFQEVTRLASKFNFIIGSETLARMLLLDEDAIEFEDGKPTNVEKLLEKLAKAEPDLVKPAQQAQQQQRPPNLPGMSPERSSITPGGNVPGRVPSLFDRDLWKK